MLARIGSVQRTLLLAVALEHRGVQIQTIASRTFRYALQPPTLQAREKTLALSLPEAFEQVANGVIDGKGKAPDP